VQNAQAYEVILQVFVEMLNPPYSIYPSTNFYFFVKEMLY